MIFCSRRLLLSSRSFALSLFISSLLAPLCLLTSLEAVAQTKTPVQLYVSRVFPLGDTPTVNQVRVSFYGQAVTLSTPDAGGDLFAVNCIPKALGHGHWVSTKDWVFDFQTRLDANDLPAGTHCAVTLNEKTRARLNLQIKGKTKFDFFADGPNIIRSQPDLNGTVEEQQVFVLTLDAPVDVTSLVKNARFVLSKERASAIGIRVLTGTERDAILEANYLRRQKNDPKIIVIQPLERFPADARVSFVWGQGLKAQGAIKGRVSNRVYAMKTRKNFTAELECVKENSHSNCEPLSDLTLNLSAPTLGKFARGLALTDGRRVWRPDDLGSLDDDDSVGNLVFKGPFPANANLRVVLPPGFSDDAGRPLQVVQAPVSDKFHPQRDELSVETSQYPALAKFSGDFGIIESEVQPVAIPVTVRNLEARIVARAIGTTDMSKAVKVQSSTVHLGFNEFPEVIRWMQKLSGRDEMKERDRSVFGPAEIAKAAKVLLPAGVGRRSAEVVGIPVQGKGFHVVEIQSLILGKEFIGKATPMYVPSSALVTNMAAHLKVGSENGLVWVTTLDKGEPVSGAAVAIYDCSGKNHFSGTTDKSGLTMIPKTVMKDLREQQCTNTSTEYTDLNSGIFAAAALGDDFTFVHSSWKEGLEAYNFGLYSGETEGANGSTVAHTVLDRSLLRADETVSMRHYMRALTLTGFGAVPAENLPRAAVLVHAGGDAKYEIPISWDLTTLTAQTQWHIPKDAKLGTYNIVLVKELGQDYPYGWNSGSFQVEEFKTPTVIGSIRYDKPYFLHPKTLDVPLSAKFFSGGALSNQEMQISYYTTPMPDSSYKGFDGFVFGSKPVHPGYTSDDYELATNGDQPVAQTIKGRFDAYGSALAHLDQIPSSVVPQVLVTKLDYRDPNGETASTQRSVKLFPSERLVGIRLPGYDSKTKRVEFQAAVVDPLGHPVSGVRVRAEAFRTVYVSHRKRSTGGVYGTRSLYSIEPIQADVQCKDVTKPNGRVSCVFVSPVSGRITLQAYVDDDQGRLSYAHNELSVDGHDSVRFASEDTNRLDLIPQKPQYESGETAQLQVRMPFRSAVSLVTVERNGVLDAQVQRITSDDPSISVPIAKSYSPNIYVSALVVAGRVPGSEPTSADMVDLGKPAFRLGIAQLEVGWKPHTLNVDVSTDKAEYRTLSSGVNNQVTAAIAVTTADGTPLPAGAEATVAVVDESLLEMKNNESWNILNKMMQLRPYEVETSTAQMEVVGKRHYGLKAVPTGGGGGHQTIRQLFKTLIYWTDHVTLDSQGRATVKFPTNDSLSSFRVVAVATAGFEQFGTGHTNYVTTQDLSVEPAVPTIARHGDQFHLIGTVKNSTTRALHVKASGQIRFKNQDGKVTAVDFVPQELDLAARQSTAVDFTSVSVPGDAVSADVVTSVDAGPGVSDAKLVHENILPALDVQTQMSTLVRLDQPQDIKVEWPTRAVEGSGAIRVALTKSLTGALDPVADFMKKYNYDDFEYRVSKAVVLNDSTAWAAVVKELPTILDNDGLLRFYPNSRQGDVQLTSYFMAIANEAGFEISATEREAMIKGLENFIAGRLRTGYESDVPTRVIAMDALVRYKPLDGNAIAALKMAQDKTPDLLDSTLVQQLAIAGHQPAGNIPQGGLDVAKVEARVRSQLTAEGLWLLLKSNSGYGLNSPATRFARLIATVVKNPEQLSHWRDDVPRLVLGFVHNQQRGTWGSTVDNAWGAVALRAFAEKVENSQGVPTVTGGSKVKLASSSGTQESTVNWVANTDPSDLLLHWNSGSNQVLNLTHLGTGAPWATVSTRAAVRLDGPSFNGFEITRTLVPIQKKSQDGWSVGDLAKVILHVKPQGAIAQVVVRDPVPAGCRPKKAVGSADDFSGGYKAYEEPAYDSYRAYYEEVEGQGVTVEYQLEFDTAGTFKVPATRVEALYEPGVFGEIPNADVTVLPGQ
jgi:uncharacterized protein YfaS (alpha-2-macroglobulin family)